MKIAKLSLFALVVAFLAVSCTSAPEGEKAEVSDAAAAEEIQAVDGTVYTVNTDNSKVMWVAKKVGGGHNGTINISEGSLTVNDGQIVGGSFVFDMNTIAALDLEGEWKQKLEGHLKTGDFFEVEKFPTGRFDLISAEPIKAEGATHKITGNLTMKDISKKVAFNANVTLGEGSIKAETPSFTIDRTEWDIKYNSSYILSAAEVKEKLIDHNVALQIVLDASPKAAATTEAAE